MFIVFNKAKINSFLISLGTVALLFVMAFFITNNKDSIQTGANTLDKANENIVNEIKINENSIIQNQIIE